MQVSWLVRVLLLVISWFVDYAEGYVAGCTWHAHIVKTSDADKHDIEPVHGAVPSAPLVDVTDAIKDLTITGIKIDEKVSIL